MARSFVETERKYQVTDDFVLPRLADRWTSHHRFVEELDPVELEALYFDTSDLRLARQGVSLRRRVGAQDAGWHLKLPTGEEHARVELHHRLGAEEEDAIPGEMVDLAFARTRGAPLQPVVRMRTDRSTLRVLDRDGRLLLEVDDDHVAADRLLDGTRLSWREVEVEYQPDGRRLAERLGAQLIGAGARMSGDVPKVARALAGVDGLGPFPPPGALEPATRGHGAAPAAATRDRRSAATGDLVGRRIREQTEELLARDTDVRRDLHDSVHRMWVATRRLRSCLTTFRPLLETEASEHLRAELGWLSGALGSARDAEVMRARAQTSLGTLPGVHVLGPVRASLGDHLLGVELAARAGLEEVLSSERYARLLDRLVELAQEPPYVAGRQGSRTRAVRRLVARELRRTDRVAARSRAASSVHREAALHELRKAAKRSRYAAETLEPILGRRAEQLAVAFENLQSVLGERHDATVFVELLRDHGARAGVRPGENGYTYGLLAGLEMARFTSSDREVVDAWRRASKARSKARKLLA